MSSKTINFTKQKMIVVIAYYTKYLTFVNNSLCAKSFAQSGFSKMITLCYFQHVK